MNEEQKKTLVEIFKGFIYDAVDHCSNDDLCDAITDADLGELEEGEVNACVKKALLECAAD